MAKSIVNAKGKFLQHADDYAAPKFGGEAKAYVGGEKAARELRAKLTVADSTLELKSVEAPPAAVAAAEKRAEKAAKAKASAAKGAKKSKKEPAAAS